MPGRGGPGTRTQALSFPRGRLVPRHRVDRAGCRATAFPWWSLLLAPPFQALPWFALTRLPYPGKPLLDGALFNIINLVWAIAFLLLMVSHPVT